MNRKRQDPSPFPACASKSIRKSSSRCFRTRFEVFVPFIPLQDEILRRVVQAPLENRNLPFTTAEDLILLKMAFHREKDLRDVRGMLWVQRGKLDLDYLKAWSSRMLANEIQQELEDLISQYDTSD